jgi:hypothetical protein
MIALVLLMAFGLLVAGTLIRMVVLEHFAARPIAGGMLPWTVAAGAAGAATLGGIALAVAGRRNAATALLLVVALPGGLLAPLVLILLWQMGYFG